MCVLCGEVADVRKDTHLGSCVVCARRGVAVF